MKKEKEKVVLPTKEDNGVGIFKDFDFSKLTRAYVQVAPTQELIKIYCSRTWQDWFNQPHFHLSENPLKYLILSIITNEKAITQKVCLNAYFAYIAYFSQNSEDLSNLSNLCNLFDLSNISKKKTNLSYFIIRIFDRLLKEGFIEIVGTEPTSTRPAKLYRITSGGIRHLFYYLLPPETSQDLSATIEAFSDEFIAFLEAYPPLTTHNRIDLTAMLQFSPALFDFFKDNPQNFLDGVLARCEHSLGSPIPRQFCNFPDKGCFEYSGPEAQALDKVCFLEGSITSMSPPQTKISEVELVCTSCGARFVQVIDDKIPRLLCKLCGGQLQVFNKKAQDFLVFTLRTNSSTFDFTVEASCHLVSEIKQIFEKTQNCKFLAVLDSKPTKKGSIIENFYYSLIAIEPALQKLEMTEDIQPLELAELQKVFCPEVVGLSSAKLALLSSIVRAGRSRKDRLNALLAGDPGVGKSFLIEQAQKYLTWSPVAFVDGGNASAVGVLGGAVRSEAGGWSIVRGALPQASGGLLFFEEMTSLSSETLDKFKQALESGVINISKAGLNISFLAETSLFSACNPKMGSFNQKSPLFTQIQISSALLDRFDLKIAIFRQDSLSKLISKKMISQITESNENINFMQQYLFKAHSLNPTFSDEAKEFFVEHCKFNPRQNRALKNLSLAVAQLRLSSSVSAEDMQTAFDFIRHQNKLFFGDSDGYSFENSAQRAILELLESQKEPIPEDELIKKLNPSDKTLIVETIRSLLRKGDINRTAKGLERVI